MMRTKALARFFVTGVGVTGVYFIVFEYLCGELGMSQIKANIISYVFLMTVSYLINTIWAFRKRPEKKTAIRFFAVNVLGFLISSLLTFAFEAFDIGHSYTGMAIAVIVPVFSFLSHSFWTYQEV